ncbi:hypothetical protein RHGRI_022802 [Rhododendron griersonianum]|uniref:Leucine-rich repeat-containing N-terminal plant-type domain-containing protein n=1 Tax=Rhododendron griersonianum TaxID=479676 RepID=A0AAV6J170_9ERIC|nr:hypothetical protein RHGRI_022802 [Rhododendron griersonianum]
MLFALLFITITIDFSCGSTTTTIHSNVSSCLENERRALIDFKENLTDRAHRLRSWVGKDCCTWKGVGCSRTTGHVIKLDLPNPILYDGSNYDDYRIKHRINRLTGEMTPSFVDLKHLSYLDLSRNNLSASGVDFLGSLKSLRYLNLSSSFFEGKVPHNLGNLSRLQYLDLSRNYYGGEVPHNLGNLSRLQYLDLSLNKFDGPIPNTLGSLTSLTVLDLFGNKFNDTIKEKYFLCNLRSLVYMDLSGNSLQGSVPCCFGNHTSLSVLKLSSTDFGGPLPSCMGNMTQLTVLDLSLNEFKGEIPNSLRNLRSLRVLDLFGNEFSGEFLSSVVGEFKNLERLVIYDNFFSGTLPSSLGRLSYLRELDASSNQLNGSIPEGPIPAGDYDVIEALVLSNNHFSGGIPMSLCNATTMLSLIDLSKNRLSGKIPRCLGNLGGIIALDLSSNNLTGQIPSSLGFLKQLEYLHLRNNSFHGELPLSLQNLTSISTLDLGKNAFTGVIPHWIGDKLHNLVFLSLQSNNFYGAPLTKSCPGDESTDDGDHQVLVSEGDMDEDETELIWFWAGVGPGFVVGLLGVFSTLFFKRKWRNAYFQLIEDAYDRIFVAIAVKANWLRRKFHPQSRGLFIRRPKPSIPLHASAAASPSGHPPPPPVDSEPYAVFCNKISLSAVQPHSPTATALEYFSLDLGKDETTVDLSPAPSYFAALCSTI